MTSVIDLTLWWTGLAAWSLAAGCLSGVCALIFRHSWQTAHFTWRVIREMRRFDGGRWERFTATLKFYGNNFVDPPCSIRTSSGARIYWNRNHDDTLPPLQEP